MNKALALMAVGQVHAATAQSGSWVPYAGAARIVLAGVLLAAAGGAAFAGTRLRLPVRPPMPGRTARMLMLAAWLSAIIVLLACAGIGIHQALREHVLHSVPVDPITPVTFLCLGVIFFMICVISPLGWRVTLISAAIGAMAAPMIFEFPFDLIVMARTYPPIPPDPAAIRVLFFAPLLLVEVITLALLALSPLVKLSRAAVFSFALMLVVFAVWALAGFGYPSAPLPFALNVVSKILAFATALCLFLPRRTQAHGRASLPAPRYTWRASAEDAGGQPRQGRGAGDGLPDDGISPVLDRSDGAGKEVHVDQFEFSQIARR